MTIFERILGTMITLLDRREDGEKGAAMVEYALLVAGIAVVVGAAVALLGGRITTMFAGFFPGAAATP